MKDIQEGNEAMMWAILKYASLWLVGIYVILKIDILYRVAMGVKINETPIIALIAWTIFIVSSIIHAAYNQYISKPDINKK